MARRTLTISLVRVTGTRSSMAERFAESPSGTKKLFTKHFARMNWRSSNTPSISWSADAHRFSPSTCVTGTKAAARGQLLIASLKKKPIILDCFQLLRMFSSSVRSFVQFTTRPPRLTVTIQQNPQSARSAMAGSIRMARRPGNRQAMRAVPNRIAATITYVIESKGLIPNSSVSR